MVVHANRRIAVILVRIAIGLAGTLATLTSASASCGRSCDIIRVMLNSGQTHILEKRSVPSFSCRGSDGGYGCSTDVVHKQGKAAKAKAERAFYGAVSAIRQARPHWKWFRAVNARYQGPGELQIYCGPARGQYFVDMWIGKFHDGTYANFGIVPKPEDTMFAVVPYNPASRRKLREEK